MPARKAIEAVESAARRADRGDAAAADAAPCLLVERRTRDAEEQAACLRGWDQVYEQLAPGSFEGRFAEARLRGIQLFRETTNRPLYQAGRVRDGQRVLGIPLQLRGRGHCRGRPIGPDSVVAVRGGGELDLRTPEDFDIVAVALPQASLQRHADEIEHCALRRDAAADGVLAPGRAQVDALRTLALSALDGLSRTPAVLRFDAAQRALESALLGAGVRLLAAPAGGGGELPATGLRHALVRQAQALMRAQVDQPLTVEDLCRALRVSRRTLQYSFQAVLQINPASYLRAMRLNGARRALRGADPQRACVQDIATRWGFWHLSRFAADYRRMFGELPSQTLRAGAGGAP